ncbi:MAG TPA: hypothetical protein VE779_09240 [Candidatus Angelobacter sp.]|nr:hypothetical protein [Candidatus Angelobacter sp.]
MAPTTRYMLRRSPSLGIAVSLSAVLLLSVRDSSAQTLAKAPTTTSQKSKRRAVKPVPVAEAPSSPAAPPTLEQQPPTPPQVTYRDGLLTISSTNATLSQVLHSVQVQTGATIEVPSGTGNERVVASLGPGKPQSVLASLLNGAQFNYVILGVPNNPGTVQKVILLSKTSSAAVNGAPANTAQNNFRFPQQQQAAEQPEDEYPQGEPEVENQNQQQPGMPGASGSENLQPDANQQGNRTPEQMLQELQRMQAQQQQMQQQLNPANQQQFGQPVAPQNQQLQMPFPTPSPQPQ